MTDKGGFRHHKHVYWLVLITWPPTSTLASEARHHQPHTRGQWTVDGRDVCRDVYSTLRVGSGTDKQQRPHTAQDLTALRDLTNRKRGKQLLLEPWVRLTFSSALASEWFTNSPIWIYIQRAALMSRKGVLALTSATQCCFAQVIHPNHFPQIWWQFGLFHWAVPSSHCVRIPSAPFLHLMSNTTETTTMISTPFPGCPNDLLSLLQHSAVVDQNLKLPLGSCWAWQSKQLLHHRDQEVGKDREGFPRERRRRNAGWALLFLTVVVFFSNPSEISVKCREVLQWTMFYR